MRVYECMHDSDLMNSFVDKDLTKFWHLWSAKINSNNNSSSRDVYINGSNEAPVIANAFIVSFSNSIL